jgi:hypothetical protein
MDNYLEKAYDEYAKNDDVTITKTVTDYAVMMKEILTRLQDLLEGEVNDEINGALSNPSLDMANALNLVKTAQDYLYYLEDNRRVII